MSVEILTYSDIIITTSNIKYGLLYNWYAAKDVRNIAPIGYRIATYADFDTLSTYLGGDTIAGGKMKYPGYTYWNTPNVGADNSSGFSVFGAGYRWISNGLFTEIKQSTRYHVLQQAGYRILSYSQAIFNNSDAFGEDKIGASIRCIRETNVGWINGEVVFDYDGNTYNTIQIGTQIWLKQNLAVTHYRNGEVIPEVTDNLTWIGLSTGALCAYNNDWSNVFY